MIPKVTTIIPTYKRPKLLARTIQSALNQTLGEIEVLVLDNDSGDETEQVVRHFQAVDGRVKYHRHPTNIGSVPNFNSGLPRVTTPFFSFVSDDDVLLPRFYEIALKALTEFPSAQFAATEVLYLEMSGRFRGTSNGKYSSGLHRAPQGLLTMLEDNHPPSWAGVLFRSEVIREVGELDLRVGPSIDYDYVLRIAAQADFIVIPEPGAVFTVHGNSVSGLSDVHSIWPGMRYTTENIASTPRLEESTKGRAVALMVRQSRHKVFYFGRQAIKQQQFDLARKSAKILRNELGAPLRSLIISATARACEWFRFSLAVLNALNRIRPFGKTQEQVPPPAVEAAIQYMAGLDGQVNLALR